MNVNDFTGNSVGNDFGAAPKTNCPVFFQQQRYTIARDQDIQLEWFRNGRYASRSMITPSVAQITIAPARTANPPPNDSRGTYLDK